MFTCDERLIKKLGRANFSRYGENSYDVSSGNVLFETIAASVRPAGMGTLHPLWAREHLQIETSPYALSHGYKAET